MAVPMRRMCDTIGEAARRRTNFMTKKILGVVLGVFVLLAAGAIPAQAQFIVNPTNITFAVSPGSNASPQLVFIQSSGGPVNFILSGQSQGGWLTYGSITSNTTPASFSVSANSLNTPVGIYTGTITVTATSNVSANPPVVINLTLVVSSGPVLVASPTSLTFTQTQVGL